MPRWILPVFLAFAGLAFAPTPPRRDLDITAPDGIKLRVAFFSAGKPGPGVLLMHMCVTTRKSWEPVAIKLSEAGINTLTIDNRGFGESGGLRYEGATPEVQKQLEAKWPEDFDAAYRFLISQSGVDNARIGAGGASCGVNNAVQLAERHPDINALVLLAGSTDLKGDNFIAQHADLPVFTAAAVDDEYNPATLQLMQWMRELSNNTHSRFEGFSSGRHGTEIFGPHPELIDHIVAFFVETLRSTSPTNVPVSRPKTAVSEFWALANEKGGAVRAAQMFHDARKRDPQTVLFAELPLNLLAYDRLQAGDTADAIELFKLNTEAYPASANAQDSLSDGYLAAGRNDLALAAEEECIRLLPGDRGNVEFKAELHNAAQAKIAKLRKLKTGKE